MRTAIGDGHIPVTIVTGLRGSGKTTWLGRQLRDPAFADTLVVLDPANAAGLSHSLVAHVRDNPAAMAAPDGGCLCCSLRQDLVRTLVNATWRYSRQGRRLYSRVAIETTGDASPGPIIETLAELPALARRYRLESVTTLMDVRTGAPASAGPSVAAEQLSRADLIVLNHTQAMGAAALDALRRRLRHWNPAAPMVAAPKVYSPAHA